MSRTILILREPDERQYVVCVCDEKGRTIAEKPFSWKFESNQRVVHSRAMSFARSLAIGYPGAKIETVK